MPSCLLDGACVGGSRSERYEEGEGTGSEEGRGERDTDLCGSNWQFRGDQWHGEVSESQDIPENQRRREALGGGAPEEWSMSPKISRAATWKGSF